MCWICSATYSDTVNQNNSSNFFELGSGNLVEMVAQGELEPQETASPAASTTSTISNTNFSSGNGPAWFEEVTIAAGLNFVKQTWGAAWGDFNGDGLPDLFLNNHLEASTLWLNQGDGTFIDITDTTISIDQLGGDTHGAMWLDKDNDGDQDLFVLVGARGGNEDDPNLFYINENNAFTDQASTLGVDYAAGRGRTPIAFDYNNDGLLDLVFVGRKRPDGLGQPTIFKQTATGFEDIGSALGFAPSTAQAIPFALLSDLTGDGKAELIYRGGGFSELSIYDTSESTFTEISSTIFPNFPSYPNYVEDDIVIADFNNDLLPDIYLTRNGIESDIALVGNTIVKARIESKDDIQGFQLKTVGSLNFNLSTPGALTSNNIFVGSSGYKPGSYEFQLSPEDPNVQGIIQPTAGVSKGIYIGYDAATGQWQVLVSSPDKKGVLSLLLTADDVVSELQAVGFDPEFSPFNDRLFINTGNGFVDTTDQAGINSVPLAGNNVAAGDFDNDGDQDIYVVSTGSAGNRPNVLYENQGDGTFIAVEGAGGAAGTQLGRGDSVALADYDLDGFLDIFIANGKWAPAGGGNNDDASYQLFRNLGNSNSWLLIDLVGVESNRDAIGSTVYATTGELTQMREQNGGIHNRAQNHQRIHFGLAQNNTVDQLETRWTSGMVNRHFDVSANQLLTVAEGYGFEGDDHLSGNASNNELYGLSGNDLLEGQSGNDTLEGGLGADTLNGGEGTDTAVYSQSTAVTVSLASGTGFGGEAEGDSLISIENITGSAFNDHLTGDAQANILDGGDGDDTLEGGLGADTLQGGDGFDLVVYSNSAVGVTVKLAQGTATRGDAAGDRLFDIEHVVGSEHKDKLFGDRFNNILDGGNGPDRLVGNGGSDTLFGGKRGDILIGGRGNDELWGEEGPDKFRFNSLQDGVDTIGDFETDKDLIQVKGSKFGGELIKGFLVPEQFVLGATASDSNHRFVYDQSTGNLSFDADGVGGQAQQLFAILSNHASLEAGNIRII